MSAMETTPIEHRISPLPSHILTALRYSSSSITIISIIITVICITIIFRTSRNTSPAYAKLLLLVTIFPISSDILFHFLFDPAPLLPLPCVLRWEPLIQTPGNPTIYYAIWVTLLCWNAVAYGACFIHRHQAVVPPGVRGKFSLRARRIFLLTMGVLFSLGGPILLIARYPGDFVILKKVTSGFTDFQLHHVDCYEIHKLYVFIGYCFTAFTICAIFLFALTIHIFALLRDTGRISMSYKTRNYHTVMIKTLILQTIVPIVFLIIPLTSCFIIFLARWRISVLYPLSIISGHSLMHSIVLICLTPLYRRDLLSIFSKVSRKSASGERTEVSNLQQLRAAH